METIISRIGKAILCFIGGMSLLACAPIPEDVPAELPPYHHAKTQDYEWKVVIDRADENWVFYTDSTPTFSLQSTNEGDAQTVVCIKNARQAVWGRAKDRYYTADKPYCVGGEGKIQIIPQSTQIKF